MSTHKEVELKMRYFEEELWDKIGQEPIIAEMSVKGAEKQMFLETIYYDTLSFSLKKEGLSYRIRQQNEEWIATVKADGVTSGGLHDRSEWSFVVDNALPDITPFYELPVGERLKNSLGYEVLREVFRTRFSRKSFDLKTKEGGLVELAVDRGEIVVGERTAPIQEIELELKEGNVAEVLQIAAVLAKNYVLLPEGESKYYRGLILANLATTEEKNPVESFRITPSEATGAAIKKVLLYYVQEVTDALEKSGKETDPIEMSYQFCDSLRRMKAVLSFSHNLINLSCDNEVLQDIGKIADESSSWHDINISRGEYVPTVFEFWAWILKNWEEQKDTMTISEYTENWFSTWVDIYLNIDIQKILNDPELIISFDKSIVEARYILEEFQAIIQKNSSELIQILKEMHERLAQDEQDKSIDKSRKNVQLLWPVLVAELSKTSSPYDDGKGDD